MVDRIIDVPDLIARADLLLEQAYHLQLNKPNASVRLAMRANRIRTEAARGMRAGPEKLELVLEIAFLAATLDDHRRACWAVREAVTLGPDEAQMEDLREYWDWSSWVLKGPKNFPEPPGELERPRSPLPGQMSFLDDDRTDPGGPQP